MRTDPRSRGGHPTRTVAKRYFDFGDEEGDDRWLQEQDDCFQQEPLDGIEAMAQELDHEIPAQANQEEGDLQAELNARLKRSSRITFFDDECGDNDLQHEPDDIHVIPGIVDRRGLPEFAKAAKYIGAWLGMVLKRGRWALGFIGMSSNLTLIPWSTSRRKWMLHR